MVKVRDKHQLKLMEKSGRISAAALKRAVESIKVGVSGLSLDIIAGEQIHKLGGQWSYKTVPGYKFAICINFNEGVVHGIPTDRKIKEGDLVSIDLAASYQGWHTDTAWTVIAGDGEFGLDNPKKQFLEIGKKALAAGVAWAAAGNRVGDISAAIQQVVEGAGFHVVRNLVGHGVGEKLHEEPEVPGFGTPGTGLELKKGMTLAIEVIYSRGTSAVVLEDDGWTVSSADGSDAALFEVTVVVGKKGGKILTVPPEQLPDYRLTESTK